ncbi:hypothetical protein ABEB36_007998 [Hypothenemus hampei]|uniref:HMG box domain-containing protein n=1 Tax=Hypothenemus hampei TaxID=57062 RepID=A0ABD1EKC4_HYPHA
MAPEINSEEQQDDKSKNQSKNNFRPKRDSFAKPATSNQFQVHKTGPITNNPFLNFLRDMRKNTSTQGLNPMELSAKGGEIWRNMSVTQKEPYYQMARQVAGRRSTRKSKKRRGRRKRSRSRSASSNRTTGGSRNSENKRKRRSKKYSRSRRRRSRRRM